MARKKKSDENGKEKRKKKKKGLLGGLAGSLLKLVAYAVLVLALGSIVATLWGPTIKVGESIIPIPTLEMAAKLLGIELNFGNPEEIAKRIAQTANEEKEKLLGPVTATPEPTSTPVPTPTPMLDPNWPFPDGAPVGDTDGDENINVNPLGQIIEYSGDLLSTEPNVLLQKLSNTLGSSAKVQQMTAGLGPAEWEQILVGLNPNVTPVSDIKIPPWKYARRLWEENFSQMPTISRTIVGEKDKPSGRDSTTDEPPAESIERGIKVLKGAKKYIGTNQNEPSKFQYVGDTGEDVSADLYVEGGSFCFVDILSGAHPGKCWVPCEHISRGAAITGKGSTLGSGEIPGPTDTAATEIFGVGTLGVNEAMILNFEGDCWLTDKGKICVNQQVPRNERAPVHPGQIVYRRSDGLWGPARPK